MRAAFRAAALVTHYRHEHRPSYDRSWSNRSYAAKIPNYNYDDTKYTVNNQAKRQLIRATNKLAEAGKFPEEAGIAAVDLVKGFQELQDNDENTNQLIAQVLGELGAVASATRSP